MPNGPSNNILHKNKYIYPRCSRLTFSLQLVEDSSIPFKYDYIKKKKNTCAFVVEGKLISLRLFAKSLSENTDSIAPLKKQRTAQNDDVTQ